MTAGFLKVNGTEIINANGESVVLKGAASGGHLNMENFITGFPGHETEHKEILREAMGDAKFDFFFEKFYEYFWTDKDAEFFASLGLNCLRVPFNYHHFLSDNDLSTVKSDGFKLLDRIVESCSKYGIFTILDLHTVPGGQNQGWHCDSGIHKALFWDYKIFQDKIIELWKAISTHYRDNTWVAGYNPLNEPGDPKQYRLIDFYDRVEKAIRSVDRNHMLFLDGNRYAADFSYFPEKPYWNSVYAIHDYSMFGFPSGDDYHGSDVQKEKLKSNYESKIEHMKKVGVPVWNGEFGPVYSSEVRDDENVAETNQKRYNVLKDQLAIYKHGNPGGTNTAISWSIWLYKDIGYQGLTYVSSESKWFQVLGPWLKKKKRLGLDKWGRDADPVVEKIFNDFESEFKKLAGPGKENLIYPWKIEIQADRVAREMLLSQYLSYEYATYFKDLSFDELDEMAASFKFENVKKREALNRCLMNYDTD